MITDILLLRYPAPWVYERLPAAAALFLRQAAISIADDLFPVIHDHERLLGEPERKLTRELGSSHLGTNRQTVIRVMDFLAEEFSIFSNTQGGADHFFKIRMSLLELILQEAERIKEEHRGMRAATAWVKATKRGLLSPRDNTEPICEAVDAVISEINGRMRLANLPFEYHNGLIQRIDDEQTTTTIEKPFWALVADPKFKNVDTEMKEALDSRDSQKSDAAVHAFKALESTLKIISDDLGRTTGSEKGATNFVDNLVSEKKGRYIETWEADAIKSLFQDIRNPLSHGAGNAKPLTLSPEQTTWVIEQAMSWIKSLVRRRPQN